MLRTSFDKRLRLETLERKAMLAGDVAVSVVGGDLFLVGDAADNSVNFSGTATPGEYVLSDAGTTFNGMPSLTVTGVTGDVTVDLGAGNDEFEMADTSLPGSFIASSTASEDTYLLGQGDIDDPRVSIAGDVVYSIDNSGLSFQLVAVDVGGGVDVSGTLGEAGLGMLLGNLSVGEDINVDLSGGVLPALPPAPVLLDGVESVGGDVNISLDSGLTSLTIASQPALGDVPMSVAGDVSIVIGENNDSVGMFPGVNISNIIAADDVRIEATQENAGMNIFDVAAGRNFKLIDGIGAAEYVAENISAGRNLRVEAGPDGGTFQLVSMTVDGDFIFKGGDGDDILFTEAGDSGNVIGDDAYLMGGDGNDELGLEEVEIGDKLRIQGGKGDDAVFVVATTVGRSTLVTLGGGENGAEIEAVDAGRSLIVVGGGTNSIDLTSVTASHFITILTSSGDDSVIMEDVTTHTALVSTKAGMDEVGIANSAFDYLFVLLGDGDDTLTLEGVTVDRWALFHGGSGEDTLVDAGDNDINFELDFSFEDYQS